MMSNLTKTNNRRDRGKPIILQPSFSQQGLSQTQTVNFQPNQIPGLSEATLQKITLPET